MLLGFFLKGAAVGAVLALPLGPVGILCLRRTLLYGRLAGLVSGLGAAVGDMVFGVVAAFGLTFVSNWLLGYEAWLAAGGACFLLLLGGRALIAAPPTRRATPADRDSLFGDFVSTLLLTLANPFTLLAFLGIFAALGLGGARATLRHAAALVVGVWSGSLLWWLALTFAMAPLVANLSARNLAWINRGSGGILLLCGAGLLLALARHHIG